MNYEEWNDLLATHFFAPENGGRKVRLNVTRTLLNELGKADGADSDDFVEAIREGHSLSQVSICLRAYHALELWYQWRVLQPPPKHPHYLAYLCFFVLAAGEGDFSEAAYYPRLRKLLGETEEAGTYPHFEKTEKIWVALEYWANKEKRGSLGLFHVRRRGKQPYVSLPRAQLLLSDRDRQRLQQLFLLAGINPDRRPSRGVLAARVREFGGGLLPLWMLKLLDRATELREYLLDDFEDELDEFEPGMVPVLPSTSPPGNPVAQQVSYLKDLLFCIEVNPPKAKCVGRFQLGEGVGETELEAGLSFTLKGEGGAKELVCGGRFPGWSSPLETSPGTSWDASSIEWGIPLTLDSRGPHRIKLRMDGGDLRVFASGLPEGLPGFVEVATLPAFGECLIAVAPTLRVALLEWGKLLAGQPSTAMLKELPIRAGLPPGWSLFHLPIVPTFAEMRRQFPGEAETESVRLLFRGGVRAPGSRSRYFAFAPPRLLLTGDCSGVEVSVCGRSWSPDVTGVFHVAPDLCEPGKVLDVTVSRNGLVLASRKVELVQDLAENSGSELHAMFGETGLSPEVQTMTFVRDARLSLLRRL